MPKARILPHRRPSAEDRRLCEGVEWTEVRDVLATTNLKNDKISYVHRLFLKLHGCEGIQYIGKHARPSESKLEYKVGEYINMTADFHSMIEEVDKILFTCTCKKGRDFVTYPNVTRDYMNGWAANDPLKRLAYAQTMIIARRKGLQPAIDASNSSEDDLDSVHSMVDDHLSVSDEEYYEDDQSVPDPNSRASVDNAAVSNEPLLTIDAKDDSSTESAFCRELVETSDVSCKRARDEVGSRAKALGLESDKKRRDEKIKAAEEAIETAEHQLLEKVEAREHEVRMEKEEEEKRAKEEELNRMVNEFQISKRRKRAENRKVHWSAVKQRQTDLHGHLKCAICNFWDYRDAAGIQITDEELRLDHKTALCLGGSDDNADNLQILCGVCDNRKTENDMERYRTLLQKDTQTDNVVTTI